MMSRTVIGVTALLVAPVSSATITTFGESFDAGAEGWLDAGLAPSTWVSTGGADGGGFLTTSFNAFGLPTAPPANAAVLFRGHADAGASNGDFAGNWIDAGVTTVTARVRHNAPFPVSYFLRAADNPAPGAFVIDFAPVLPGLWTEIEFDVSPTSAQIVSFGGSDYANIFDNIERLQFGINIDAAISGLNSDVTYDFDLVSVTPAPATASLLALGLIGRRRR